MKQHKIKLNLSDLLDLKYWVLKQIMQADSEEDTQRFYSLNDLLSALEKADEEFTVSLTMPQILRLAYLTLSEMNQKNGF